MAELDKWLHIPGFENVDIDVDMLDFPFIENCSDWVKLAKIVHILKSGQEGYYPELLLTAESKLLEKMPTQEKKKYLALTRTASDIEVEEAQKDLEKWTTELKHMGTSDVLQPGMDFDDVSSFLSKAQLNKLKEIFLKYKVATLTPLQRQRKADMERRKGNESFKAGDYDEAISFYSNSLSLHAHVEATWTNRAIAYIKKELFENAEKDCMVAVYLNPSSIKGLTRRGIARLSQGKYKEAAVDFNTALNLQSNSKELQKLLGHALEKYKEVEGIDLRFDDHRDGKVFCSPVGIEKFVVKEMTNLELPPGNFLLWKKSKISDNDNYVRIPVNEENDNEISESEKNVDQGFIRISIQDESDDDEEVENTSINESIETMRIPLRGIQSEMVEEDSLDPVERALQLKELGNQFMAKNEYQLALDAYNSSISTFRTVAAVNNRAQAYINLRNFEAAIHDCSEVLGKDNHNLKALFRRGKAYCETGLLELAEEDLRTLIQLDSTNEHAIEFLSDIKRKLNERRSQLALNADRLKSDTLKFDGNVAMNQGEYLKALELYSDSIELNATNIASRSNRVLAFIKLGRFQEAIADATIIIDGLEDNEVIKRKAMFRRAEAYYNRAIELKSIREESLIYLRHAEQDVSKLLKLEPNAPAIDLQCLIEVAIRDVNNIDSVEKLTSASASPVKKDLTKKPQVPREPPKTLYEFEKCWKSLQSFNDLKVEYISSFKKATFRKVLKDSISTDFLESIVEVLDSEFCNPATSKKFLEALVSLPSISFVVSLLSDAAQKGLKRISNRIEEHFGKRTEDQHTINLILRQFA